MKALTAMAMLALGATLWAQGAVSEHTSRYKTVLHTFTSPDGTFRITYPDVLIRCERRLFV